MNKIRSIIGALLTLLGAFAALFLVAYDKIKQWRERREMALHEARMKKEIVRIRDLVDQQRDIVLKHRRDQIEVEERAQKKRDAVDVANDIINEAKHGKR